MLLFGDLLKLTGGDDQSYIWRPKVEDAEEIQKRRETEVNEYYESETTENLVGGAKGYGMMI